MIDFAKLLEQQIAAEEKIRAEYCRVASHPNLVSAIERWLERRENHIDQLKDELGKVAS